MLHLKKFTNLADYQSYKNSGNAIHRPCVCYVESNKFLEYFPALKLKATYNATSSNKILAENTRKISSLKINDVVVNYEPLKEKKTIIKNTNITLNDDGTVPISLDKFYIGTPHSFEFRPSDKNVKISDVYGVIIIIINQTDDGELFPGGMFVTLDEFITSLNGVIDYNSTNDTFYFTEDFFAMANVLGFIPYTFAFVNKNEDQLIPIDTDCIIKEIVGGLPELYEFESEGVYNVEIELFDEYLATSTFNSTCIETVILPLGLKTIGYYAFYGCDNLTNITIPDSVTTIEYQAFCSCDNLTSITIPDSVTTIGEDAFGSCGSLTSITIPDSVTTIGGNAFRYCSNLAEFNGKFASKDGRCLIVYGVLNSFAPYGLTEYTIPDGVTTIGEDAFYNCDSLTSVTIGNSVTTIGSSAFNGCDSLTSVTIGNSVTTIGDYAFFDCTSLTSVYCEATTPPSLDGSYVFDCNASGRKIYVPAASVEAYKTAEYWSEYASDIEGYEF